MNGKREEAAKSLIDFSCLKVLLKMLNFLNMANTVHWMYTP